MKPDERLHHLSIVTLSSCKTVAYLVISLPARGVLEIEQAMERHGNCRQWSAEIRRIHYTKQKREKRSRFFALVPGGKNLVAVFTDPQSVIDRLKKNHRDHKTVYSVNKN